MQTRHHQLHFWSFLRNKEMNEIYLSYGVTNFALGLVSIFVPIYLYKLGFPLPWILGYYFMLPLSSVLLTNRVCARVVAKSGVKWSMLIAVLFKMLFFTCLYLLPAHRWLFFVLPLLNMLKTQISSLGYHLNFIEHSDAAHRGRQVSILQSTALAANLLAPLIGGVVIGLVGFKMLFVGAIMLMAVAAIPILILPTHKNLKPVEFDIKNMWRDMLKRENLPLFLSYGGYAIEEWIGFVVWSLFLFFILHNTESVGAASSIVAAVTFLVFYLVGRLSDKVSKKKLIKLGTFLYFFGWVGRLFADSFSSVIFIDSYKNITGNFLQVPWSAFSYDLAARRNYFRFIVQRELMFDLARVMVAPIIILVFVANYHPFLIAFTIAALASLGYMTINYLPENMAGEFEKQ